MYLEFDGVRVANICVSFTSVNTQYIGRVTNVPFTFFMFDTVSAHTTIITLLSEQILLSSEPVTTVKRSSFFSQQ